MMIKFICIEPMLWKGNTLTYKDEGIATPDEFAMLQAAGNVAFKCRIEEVQVENQMVNLGRHIEKRVTKMSKRVK